MSSDHASGQQIQSTVRSDGTLKISIETVPTPTPEDAEVIVQVGASPINPSDLGLLFGGADMTTARIEDGAVIADIPAIEGLVLTANGDLVVARYVLAVDEIIDGAQVNPFAPRLTVLRRDGDDWLIVAHANFSNPN